MIDKFGPKVAKSYTIKSLEQAILKQLDEVKNREIKMPEPKQEAKPEPKKRERRFAYLKKQTMMGKNLEGNVNNSGVMDDIKEIFNEFGEEDFDQKLQEELGRYQVKDKHKHKHKDDEDSFSSQTEEEPPEIPDIGPEDELKTIQ